MAGHATAAIFRTLVYQLWRIRSRRELREFAGLCGELGARVASCVGTSSLRSLAAQLDTCLARLRYHFWIYSPDRRLHAVKDYWGSVVRRARHAYLAEHGSAPPPIEASSASQLQIGELSEPALIGFNTREVWQGKAFRWSRPVAVVRTNMQPADQNVTIDTDSIRGAACDFAFGLFWNGYGISRKDMEISHGRITFPIRSQWFRTGREQLLTIVAASLRPTGRDGPRDERRLGMPILSIDFAGHTTSTQGTSECRSLVRKSA